MTTIALRASFPVFTLKSDPIIVPGKGRRRKSFEERFLDKVRIAGTDECWTFLGCHDSGSLGYGRISRDGVLLYAHRAAYELALGPIAPGMLVTHRCDNPRCCNPNHLRLGTPASNASEMVNRHRSRGHLKADQVRQIDAMLKDGISHKRISTKFSISEMSVRRIAWGTTWSKVTGRETPSERVAKRRRGTRRNVVTMAEGATA